MADHRRMDAPHPKAPPRSNASITLIILAVAAVPFLSLRHGVPDAHDLGDHLAMASQFRDGLGEGNLYPRWLGELHGGWGEPTMLFYPPALYYVTAIISLVFLGDIVHGLFMTMFLFTCAGALGLYLLTSPLWGRGAGLVAGAIFVLAPYRAFELHAAGLFSSYAAGCILPWCFLFLWRLSATGQSEGHERPTRRTAVLLWPLSYAAVILTNLPAAVLLTYLVAAWTIVELWISCDWKSAGRIVLGGGLGALLAAAYLLPAVTELPEIVRPHSDDQPEMFAQNFVLQWSGSWMPFGLWKLFARMAAWPALAFLVALLVTAVAVRARNTAIYGIQTFAEVGARSQWIRLLAVAGAVAFFLATPLSEPAWRHLPFLNRVNLPWRLLSPFAISVAALGGAAVASTLSLSSLPNRRTPRGTLIHLSALGVPLLLSLHTSLNASRLNGHLSSDEVRARLPEYRTQVGYFLPAGATKVQDLPRAPRAHATTNRAAVDILAWQGERRVLRVDAPQLTQIHLRTYFYPGWRAKSGERDLELSRAPHGGILISVPTGRHEIEVSFAATPTRQGAVAASAVALLIWLALAAPWVRRRSGTQTTSSPRTSTRSSRSDAVAACER